MGSFVRWIFKGCKGKPKQFYEETHKGLFIVIDFFLGFGLFFGIMFCVVKLKDWGAIR